MGRTVRRRIRAFALALVMFVSVFQGIPGTGMDWSESVEAATVLRWPVPGHTNRSQRLHGNNAIDISDATIAGATIVAALGGTVEYKYTCGSQHYGSEHNCHGFGTGLVIRGTDGRAYQYAHMQAGSIPAGINKGSTVSTGQQIGRVGTTGNSSGNHLHFGICWGNYWEGAGNPDNETYIYDSEHNPEGVVDNISASNGQIHVSGWAFDRDATGAQLDIHVYIGGPAGTGECHPIKANTYRPDVNQIYGVGEYHGYDAVIKTNKTGNQAVYIYAINVGKDGRNNGKDNPELNHRTVNIPPAIDYKVNTGTAGSINNTSATISGSLSPSGTAASWGFYLGEDRTNMSYYTVSASPVASNNMSSGTVQFKKLKPGTTYYYQVWANVNNQIKTGSVSSFTTTAAKPDIPTIKTDAKSKEIGIGDSPGVSWNSTAQAEYYKLRLYAPDGTLVETSDNVEGNKYVFGAVEQEGIYTAAVEAYNSVGTKGESKQTEITVHPDVTVKFMDADSFADAAEDYEPEVLSEQQIHWGASALKPADPKHTGYTFKKWDGAYQNLKADTVVKAVYEINTYHVKFVDSITAEELGSQKVEYYSSAQPVDFDVPEGYVKTGYDGWDKNYQCITEDTTLYTCIGWYNDNFPIYAQIVSAVREYDSAESDNEGYTIVTRLKNWEEGTTKGRVVVALKTEKGKLLTTTESSAFSIKKSKTKELEIFVPYDKAASVAEVYVVGQYKDAVPITTTASNNAVMEIDQSMTYTDWSEEQPPENARASESRKEYRYQDKSTTTSYATSLDGYIQSGSEWVQSGSGSVDYVNSWPAGFNRGSAYFSTYNKNPLTPYENSTEKRNVSTSVAGYLYWHWCRGNYHNGPVNRAVSDCWTGEFNTFHAFASYTPLGYNGGSGAFQNSRPDICRDTYWWLGVSCWNGTQLPVYRCNYTDYKKQFHYYKWSDYSPWSTTAYQASASRNVETRTVYRYQTDDMMVQDDSGEERVISGSLGENFANREAALFIYKVDEASDYTNEYVAQTVLDGSGNYEFRFKLREEPTAETGDFTIALGIEGTSTAIYLDKIEAPKKEYSVTFYNYNGDVISTEKVKEGESAALPDDSQMMRDGYTFTRWSDTNVNITSDKEIYPEYELNKYNVVFIDWEANTVDVKEFEYGAQLVAPQAEEPEEGKTVEWDAIADGDTVVTGDRIVTTRYTTKTCRVQIMDFDNHVISDEAVLYGEAADLPELAADDTKYIFLGWKNIANGVNEALGKNMITQNVILCPEYLYTETTDEPTASLDSGEYSEAKTVTLSCPTEDAEIYYTLDGSSPKNYGAMLYTEPIRLDGAAELKFYACSIGRNDSEIQSRLYAVNYDGAMSNWMLRDDLPDEVKENMSAYELYSETGYTYKDTRTTTRREEAMALENTGWSLAEGQESYTEYSDWAEQLPEDNGSYIAVDVESKPIYTSASKYVYSHYAYEEGTATLYAATKPQGKESVYEETEEFARPLSIAGFDNGDRPYYVYDGQIWYNQKRITGNVQSGTKYRWRYKIAVYEKWSDYSIEEPAPGEEREYKEAVVYSYVRHNNYVVTIYANARGIPAQKSFLAEEGSQITALDYENAVGYQFGGFYTDVKYSNRWDPERDTVSQSLDLYAKYIAEKYTVTFVDQNGKTVSTQKVNYMEAADAPNMKEIAGYRFIGWDTEEYLNVSHDMQVTAKYVPEEEYATVKLDNSSIRMYIGKTMELTAIVTPAGQSDTKLVWTSDNEAAAVVSSSGTVTGVGAGTAVIRVTVKETGESAECQVTVLSNLETSIGILKNSRLSKDAYGYLRGIRVGSNTVSEVSREFENEILVFKDADGNTLTGNSKIGTGAVVCLMSKDKLLDSITAVVAGDVSGDGVISNKDVSLLARALLEKEQPTDVQILAGDVNGDGQINNRDISMISRIRLGKETF